MDLTEKWCFTKEKTFSNSSGSKDAAAEFIVRSQVAVSYDHKCYEGCQNKGIMCLCCVVTHCMLLAGTVN
jgi:hypothetical protein